MPIVSSEVKTNEAVRLISKFQKGDITPLYLGPEPLFRWVGDVMVADLLPSTILTLAGLSNHGKTHLLQRIENALLDHNDDVVILRCNWESTVYKLLARTIKLQTDISMKSLLMEQPSPAMQQRIKKICDKERREGIYYYEDSVDVPTFQAEVLEFLNQHPTKKIVISIDHVGLVKGREKAAIDALFEAMNFLKKQHPYVVFLPLMQLERSKLIGRLGDNFKEAPNRGDLYGSDQLLQVSDGVIVVYNPAKEGSMGKYMKFFKGKYDYVDASLRTMTGDKYEHFIPEGNIFYHAIKARDIDDIQTFKGVFVEHIYDVKEPEETKEDTEDILTDFL